MAQKRLIRAKDVVDDILSGMSDSVLMEKYKLSSRGLQSIFRKLLAAKAIRPSELASRSTLYDDTVAIEDLRNLPRDFIEDRVSISVVGQPETKCFLQDLSDTEVQLTGIKAEVDEIRLLRVETEEFTDIRPFEFYALCRWAKKDLTERNYVAVFEIADISEEDRLELRKLLELLSPTFTLKDWPDRS